jgi:hypothetical protein
MAAFGAFGIFKKSKTFCFTVTVAIISLNRDIQFGSGNFVTLSISAVR